MKKANKIDEILNKCCNLYGHTLSIPVRMKIKRFLAFPTAQSWDDICGAIIWNAPLINIHTQYCNVNPQFNVLGRNFELDDSKEWQQISEWKHIPTPMELIIALKKLHEVDDSPEDDNEGEPIYKYNSDIKSRRKLNRKQI